MGYAESCKTPKEVLLGPAEEIELKLWVPFGVWDVSNPLLLLHVALVSSPNQEP